MRILELRDIAGPNIYSDRPVLRMKADLRGTGTDSGEAVKRLAVELAEAIGIPSISATLTVADEAGATVFMAPYELQAAMQFVFEAAVELACELAGGRRCPLDEKIAEGRRIVEESAFGPSTQATLDAADRRGIPWTPLDPRNSLVRLGWGVHSRTIQATICSDTNAVAVDIASNKDLTKRLLTDAGLPVPKGRIVTTADEAVLALPRIGAPVVVKPLDGNQGRGVSLNLHTDDEVREAFEIAQAHSSQVIVEQLFTGRDYRVLVINGRMIAASEKTPARVVGDGAHTIAELIDLLNEDPRRGDQHCKPLSRIKVDPVLVAFLRRNGWDLDSVPPEGEAVLLRDSANLSTGGEARDVTDTVHPGIRLMCERAARVIGLNICGLDVVLPDIQEPFRGHGGIIEVNAAPGLRMHQAPSEGQPRDAGAAIIDMLFPDGSDGRIPVVSVAGRNGKTTTTRMIGHVLSAAGKCTGVTTSDGIFIDGREVVAGGMAGPLAARVVLGDPAVEVAILETDCDGVVQHGLGFDSCHVAVFTNFPEGIGHTGVAAQEQARTSELIAKRVREGGAIVLNGDDHRLAALATDLRIAGAARRIVLFSMDSTSPVIATHLAAGGSACVLHGDWIELRRPEAERRLIRASSVPGSLGATAAFQIANALAAVAACIGLDIPAETVAAAMMQFSNVSHNEGRLNVFRVHGGIFIADRGQNADAIGAVADMLRRWPAVHRSAILGLAAHRSDDAILAAARAAAFGFQTIIIMEDANERSRPAGDVGAYIQARLRDVRPAPDIEVTTDELEAVRNAVERTGPGEVTVAFCERASLVVDLLKSSGAVPVEDAGEIFRALREGFRVPA